MGNITSRFAAETKIENFTRYKLHQYRVVMVGLDNAGKSTLLYRLKLGKNTETLPTLGFNMEEITECHASSGKAYSCIIWDLAGQENPKCLRHLWAHHTIGSDGVIFVVDCADKSRLSEAKMELNSRVLSCPELERIPLVIAANKQDVEGAIRGNELATYLELSAVTASSWRVVETSGQIGAGVKTALDTMYSLIENQKRREENKFSGTIRQFKELFFSNQNI